MSKKLMMVLVGLTVFSAPVLADEKYELTGIAQKFERSAPYADVRTRATFDARTGEKVTLSCELKGTMPHVILEVLSQAGAKPQKQDWRYPNFIRCEDDLKATYRLVKDGKSVSVIVDETGLSTKDETPGAPSARMIK